MLEILKTEKVDGLWKEELRLILNGKILPTIKFPKGLQVYELELGFHVDSYNLDINKEIKLLTANEFPEIVELELFWKNLDDFSLYIEIQFFKKEIPSLNEQIVNAILFFKIHPDLKSWKRNYSFIEYKEKFNRNLQSFENLGFSFLQKDAKSFDLLSIQLSISHTFSNASLVKEFTKYEEVLLQCQRQSIAELEKESSKNSIVASLNFPEEIKVPCEQYLLYFAQFLQDLGINATSNLKEEAGKVLFLVTPTDDIEALDKIREALAVYLNLPSSPVLYNDSFQSMQLKQQVENLQHSQRMKEMEMRSAQYALLLAQQNIENQDKIISQQNSFIDNQNKIIEKITSKSIMIDSLENKEELEKFCEGFEVGKSEFLIKHLGLHLNPATVLKNVGKKIIGKEEGKSILDLNDETKQEDN